MNKFIIIFWKHLIIHCHRVLFFLVSIYKGSLCSKLISVPIIVIFCCDQAALRTPLSVCLSVRLSVRPSVCLSVTPFSLCSCHRIITQFSGVITNDRSDVHAKGQGHRSKVKVTEVITQLSPFRIVTPV